MQLLLKLHDKWLEHFWSRGILKSNCTDTYFWTSYSISEPNLLVSDFSKFLSINSFSITSPPLWAWWFRKHRAHMHLQDESVHMKCPLFLQSCRVVRMLNLAGFLSHLFPVCVRNRHTVLPVHICPCAGVPDSHKA